MNIADLSVTKASITRLKTKAIVFYSPDLPGQNESVFTEALRIGAEGGRHIRTKTVEWSVRF